MEKLVSINVGLPRDIEWRGETVHTAVWKESVHGRRMVRRLNIDGDRQGDLAGHGGEHRAVMVYQLESYRYWQDHFGRTDFTFGQFGENFTVEALPDSEVCIGDKYQIGGALFEVTQPRVTCYRVGIRMAEPAMPALLVSHRRPGFYFRVLEEGEVGAGDQIIKVADGPERITVAEIDGLLYLPDPSRAALEKSLRIPALSSGWKRSLLALVNRSASDKGNPGLTSSPAPRPAWAGFRPQKVERVQRETDDVVSLFLEAADQSPLPAALPGQFLVLRLPVAPNQAPVLRNYSLSGPPGAEAYRVSVKHELNGTGSSFIHDRVQPGDVLEVSAPRGSFTLQAGEKPVVLVSAGIGATPVLAMLHSLAASASQRKIWWLYGARKGKQHPFAAESRELLRTLPHARSHIAYSNPDPSDQVGQDFDSVGRLNHSVLDQLGITQDAEFYLCGPASFLHSFSEGLKAWGADPAQVRFETFGAQASLKPGIKESIQGPVHFPFGTPGDGPRVSFTRSGLTVAWDKRFISLLELAEGCGVPVRWSCRSGVCHTCETPLIGGTVAYRPDPLEPPAEGNILLCCSQPSSEIEIDL